MVGTGLHRTATTQDKKRLDEFVASTGPTDSYTFAAVLAWGRGRICNLLHTPGPRFPFYVGQDLIVCIVAPYGRISVEPYSKGE